jgi:hypothetical protein
MALAQSVAEDCWVEVDDCTVCWHAGANINCSTGSGFVVCPDQLIGNDAPFRTVLPAGPDEAGHKLKRSEHYGSCRWQPRREKTEGEGCEDDGDPQSMDNVVGEEVYGDSCTGGGGGGT